ncbi:class I SAM-dependent methyltransferase [Oceanicaulis sp.]|uniref:class I SAM-dependent methyltransferase n=1 Tax=Oceanicaulis sp. TaxID=1924941 RepID=UPI003F70C6EB
MRTDALDIARFYRTPPGRAARDMVQRRIQALWPNVDGLDMLGFGYAPPFLEPFRASARRTIAFMPAAQGAVPWPSQGVGKGGLTMLGDEQRFGFKEALFDRVILVHALEEAADPARLLREVWRVMAPEGRLLVIAAHRSGLWSRVDSTPFGHGRPFSRSQLGGLLSDALFEPVAWSRALYAPPWRFACGPKTVRAFESTGERLWPAFGGLILSEAVKHVGAVRPGGATQRVRRNSLEGATRPALSPRSDTTSHSDEQKGAS